MLRNWRENNLKTASLMSKRGKRKLKVRSVRLNKFSENEDIAR